MRAPNDPYAGMTDEETQEAINKKYAEPYQGRDKEILNAVTEKYSAKTNPETAKTPEEITGKISEVTVKMINGQASEKEVEQALGLFNFLKVKFMHKEKQTDHTPEQK